MSEIEASGGTVTAQHVVGAFMDRAKELEIPVSGRTRAILGKQAKELLVDGFKSEVVLTAAVIAHRRGEPHNMWRIADDIVTTQAGQRMTRSEYEGELNAAKLRLDPVKAAQRERLERVLREEP